MKELKSRKLAIIAENTKIAADPAEQLLLKHAKQSGKPFTETPLSLIATSLENKEKHLGYLEGTSMQGRFYLFRLAVLENNRQQGIGSFLISELEKIVTTRGDAEIVVDTWNFQAEEFYISLGYNVIGRLPDLPNGAGKVWMSKKLPPPSKTIGKPIKTA